MKRLIIKKREVLEGSEIIEIPEERMVRVSPHGDAHVINGIRCYIEVRKQGKFANKAIYLSSNFDWVVGVDDAGEKCLVPLLNEYDIKQ